MRRSRIPLRHISEVVDGEEVELRRAPLAGVIRQRMGTQIAPERWRPAPPELKIVFVNLRCDVHLEVAPVREKQVS